VFKENRAPVKIVLGGNSQVHAQMDHRLLNRRLGTNYYCADLAFPGNRACDYIWLNRELEGSGADVIVCYLSENMFFGVGLSYGTATFLSARDFPEFAKLGWRWNWHLEDAGSAVLANLLPMYRNRESIERRILGNTLTTLGQRRRDAGLASDLEARAVEAAMAYTNCAQTRFEMAAFEDFVGKCKAQRRLVVVCCGQLNPILGKKIDPQLRIQLIERLRQIAARYDNVRLLEENAMPFQSASDYADLTHANEAARARFSTYIADELAKLAPASKTR
jgi:hypothetical protein